MERFDFRSKNKFLLLSFISPSLIFAFSVQDLANWGISKKEAILHPKDTAMYLQGKNPHPTIYNLPKDRNLSAVAKLGKILFYDKTISLSGKLSCVSCHDPLNAYEPPRNMKYVMYGGAKLKSPAFRPPPTLRYLYRQKVFSIGPDLADQDGSNNVSLIPPKKGTKIFIKKANSIGISAMNLVPQGGLFLDGRADTLQEQADGPITNPVEMAAPSHIWLVERLKTPYYQKIFKQLFGLAIYKNPELLVSEMEFAIARYEIEDKQEFYPFNSKYDKWIQGKVTFTPAQMRGYFVFNNPKKGNCAACHTSQPSKDGLPPLFTDQQYEAIGVPRNMNIPANHNPKWYDLGICGPFRKNFQKNTQYCGMFLTPTLRNVARKQVFFHNAKYSTLKEVLDFCNYRDTNPEKIYPKNKYGVIEKFNDLPIKYRKNVDVVDPPFNRHIGEKPAMSEKDEKDIIAFLKTLNDSN